jgi:signal transduction histidine kinase/CheY-like chemotaxis protein
LQFRRPIFLLALAALVPLIVFSAVLGGVLVRQQQSALRRDLVERTDRIAAAVDRELEAQVALLAALSDLPLLDQPTANTEDFAAYAERVRRGQPLWFALSLSDTEGNRLVDVPEPIGGRQGGEVVDKISHRETLESRRPLIGRMLRGARGHPAFAIRAPVLRGGRVLAVLSAVVGPDAVRDILLAARLPEGWIGAIVDDQGRFVARSSGTSELIGEPASSAVRNAIAREGAGIYEGATLEGVPTVGAHRKLTKGGWSVHVGLPRAAFYAPLVQSLWLLVGGAVASLGLLTAFVFLLLREVRLRERQKAALAEANNFEALGRMTGGVAHDFNNLLMIVMGGADAIKRRRDNPDKTAQFADAMLQAAKRGQALTQQLLAFARRSNHSPESLLVQERAASIKSLLEQSARGNIAVSVTVPDETWPIHVDATALEVALVNLAVNARDAMPDGGRLALSASNVSLTGERKGDANLKGDFVALSMRDTGPGIPADIVPRIFEPFFTTSSVGHRSGLGLSQVYGFAKQSGGAVMVEGAPGEGAIFTLYLPRAGEAPARQVSPVRQQERQVYGRLLLVEDNREVAQVAESMLTMAGYTVVWAASGTAALDLLDNGEVFDAILSDVVMQGGLSGLDLALRIRERHPAMPIVLMTGYSEALAKSSSRGFPVLSKPFTPADAIIALHAATEEMVRSA